VEVAGGIILVRQEAARKDIQGRFLKVRAGDGRYHPEHVAGITEWPNEWFGGGVIHSRISKRGEICNIRRRRHCTF
jgi:hypothetical protein